MDFKNTKGKTPHTKRHIVKHSGANQKRADWWIPGSGEVVRNNLLMGTGLPFRVLKMFGK
jgi:hypothetical protein